MLYDTFEGILYKSLKFASKDKKEDVIWLSMRLLSTRDIVCQNQQIFIQKIFFYDRYMYSADVYYLKTNLELNQNSV